MAGLLPVLLQVGEEAGDEHDVERAVARHLIRDVQVAAAGVADRHGPARPCGQLEAWVLPQDLQLELLQRRPRLEAELLDQRPAPALKRVQRVGLPAAAIQRQHQLAAQPLSEHVLGDQRLELRHQLEMAAGRQIGIDPILQRREPQLLQPGDLALRERLAPQIGQRLPPPQRQRITQPGRAIPGIPARTRPLDQQLKPRHIDLIRRRAQQIPRRPRPDPLSPQQLAQRRHMPVQRVLRATRRILTPQRLDQLRARAPPHHDATPTTPTTHAASDAPGSHRTRHREPSANQAARSALERGLRDQGASSLGLPYGSELLEDAERAGELLLCAPGVAADDKLGQQEARPRLLPRGSEGGEPLRGSVEEPRPRHDIAGGAGRPTLEPVGEQGKSELLADLGLLARRRHQPRCLVPPLAHRRDLAVGRERHTGGHAPGHERDESQCLVEAPSPRKRERERRPGACPACAPGASRP